MKSSFIIKFILMTPLYSADFVQKCRCGFNKIFVYATLSFSFFWALNFIISQKLVVRVSLILSKDNFVVLV